ncbi:MAG: OadG family transporter subunit [Victivallaceae bacterium]|nr:OadG family transporter subunit [Victivallaceae bacterium]
MSNEELIISGLKLMVLGMGWVYCFLAVMIVLMCIQEKVLAPFKNALMPAAPAPKKPAASSDDVKLAAIAATAVEMARR